MCVLRDSGVVLPPWLLGSVRWAGVLTPALDCTQGTHSDSHPLFLTRLTCLASIKEMENTGEESE